MKLAGFNRSSLGVSYWTAERCGRRVIQLVPSLHNPHPLPLIEFAQQLGKG